VSTEAVPQVLAAPDFPLTSTASLTAVGARDIVAQAADVSFVIAGVIELTARPGPLQGLVGPGPVAVMGHSDGGATAAGVAFADSAADGRVGAAVILSGATGEKHLIGVEGGSHIGPFTTDDSRGAVSTVIVDFLRAKLYGDAQAADAFTADTAAPALQVMA
jgi:hypothetical protein